MTTKRTELYYPDGRVLVREWEPGTRPAYEWLSKAVEGYIELVSRFLDGGPEDRVQAYANEEGRLRNMPGNVPGMKALKWPEPPGGWDAFDPDNVGKSATWWQAPPADTRQVEVPGIWRLVMFVIRNLPRSIMRRVGF